MRGEEKRKKGGIKGDRRELEKRDVEVGREGKHLSLHDWMFKAERCRGERTDMGLVNLHNAVII